MITGINELKTLTKHISCKCKCRFDRKKRNSNQWWNNDKCRWESIKTIPTNFNEKKITCKMQNFYILLAFLLITIALLIAVNIYCDLIKYRVTQKHLLPFHDTKFCVGKIY